MNKKVDMVSVPKKSFWNLSIPLIGFCIFNAFYGIVDMVWISQISIHASFAVGISIPFVSLIFAFGDSIGMGTNSLMSRFMGADDYENAYNTLIHGLLLSNIIWVLIVICALFTQGLLYDVNQSESYLLVWDYLIPIITFAYIFIMLNVFSETFQAEGNSKIPTILMISSNILNIILDPIFIFTLHLGIKGAAYTTVLSSMIPFIIFLYLYTSGKTKVPLSKKYFKFRPYIITEIFKVALPNFLDSGLWAFSSSFINGILLITMGEIGPILYSVSNKIRTLLSSPTRGYGGALMSVTGHLFGGQQFDKLNEMYKYVLKVSIITAVIVMIGFMIIRNYAYKFFSITGMESQILWIAIFGIFIIISISIATISSKMLDGFGKSMYSLLFTIIKIIMQVSIIFVLFKILANASCVLIGITVSEVVFAIIYYLFLRYLFNNFDKQYENKDVVKKFDADNDSGFLKKIKKYDKTIKNNSIQRKILYIIELIAMLIVVIEIILSPISFNDYSMFASGIICLTIGTVSILLLKKIDQPKISLIGFMISALLIFTFMTVYGNSNILLFIITQILIIFIIIILKKLKS
ncbi:MATE family efflux transporter [uncultured Methanobrevibacter sp.]|uniref:MATE family efflux transporter n=1 Tax=uncultured Methanobrevibacter sp. TaxID=253161 RepID=UPI0025CECE61|nr:MATE family efflux transporter [uncultured Methanobrevibacter sp.]